MSPAEKYFQYTIFPDKPEMFSHANVNLFGQNKRPHTHIYYKQLESLNTTLHLPLTALILFYGLVDPSTIINKQPCR